VSRAVEGKEQKGGREGCFEGERVKKLHGQVRLPHSLVRIENLLNLLLMI